MLHEPNVMDNSKRQTHRFHCNKLTLAAALALTPFCVYAAPNYTGALQKSMYFYEAQRSGALPDDNRVPWRGDSGLEDGLNEGVDLTGGWYDAGDHVKFGFPMAATTTLLAWGILENKQAYEDSGQLKYALDNIKWSTDYFLKAHTAPNELWGQVGNGGIDHAWWGPAEVMPLERPAYKIDENCPGSDLAGSTAAALAASAMVFSEHDPVYAEKLLVHATQLYDFADKYRGKYSDCIVDAQLYYDSESGYQDELAWGALWLHKATGNPAYLAKARIEYEKLSANSGKGFVPYTWTHTWDDKSYGAYVLMAQITREARYQDDVERWLDYWTIGYNGERVPYTPGGLAWLDQWGPLRYAANTSLLALIYSDYLTNLGVKPEKAQRYHDFAKRQIDYMLGANPHNRSFVVGYGPNAPLNPHHRTAHGSWTNDIYFPAQNRHILYGALVGGPSQYGLYSDDRSDYIMNEVATDYNAGFTGALARLSEQYGGGLTEDFPPAIAKSDEFFVEAKINYSSTNVLQIDTILRNRSAWPAQSSDKLSYRYFVDLSELQRQGFDPRNLDVSVTSMEGATVSSLLPWNEQKGIYYVEIYFDGVDIYPGGLFESNKHAQLRLSLPQHSATSSFDFSNDWSFNQLNPGYFTKTARIPVYDNGQKISGYEPGEETPQQPRLFMAQSVTYDETLQTSSQEQATEPEPALANENQTVVSTCQIEMRVDAQWNEGFVVNVTISNLGETAIGDWQLVWRKQMGIEIVNLWSGEYQENGVDVIVAGKEWNSIIQPYGSIEFGFQGSGPVIDPAGFALNGESCVVSGA